MKKRDVSIIILTWNGLSYTQQCLNSLKQSALAFGCNVYIVDNGSTDGTKDYLQSLDWIHLICLEENVGFVGGNNIAINRISGDDIILLNNDIIISQDDWLIKLYETAYKREDYGVIGCRLKNEKGELLHAGTYILKDTYWGQQIGGGETDIGQFSGIREVEGIVFACAYIKRKVIDIIGGLNTKFFSYFEDTDYCFRANKAGFKVICCGEVTLIHYQNVSTEINRVSFSRMFMKSQNTFKHIWKDYFADNYHNAITWHSIVEGKSGYAVSARNFMKALDEKGVDNRYRYAYGKNTPITKKETNICGDYKIDVFRKRKICKNFPQVTYGVADVFDRNNSNYKIGYTMLETTGIPDSWVQQCNSMNEVWVPSHFNKDSFTNCGVKVPIYVIPLGVDCNIYNPQIKSYKKNNRYIFLSVFEWGERKAPEILLQAYIKAFTVRDEVALICKINNNDSSINLENEVRKLQIPTDGPEIIFLYNVELEDYEMPALYRSADCFVTATRGEGWGMPILEAMACGLPVIATNWSAQTEYLSESNGFPVDAKSLIDAKAKCIYYKGFKWAQPSEEHLIEQMRYVYMHREEAKRKGERAALDVQNKWTWMNAADKIVDRLQDISNG